MAATYLLSRPLSGMLVHDAMLYAAQALVRADIGSIDKDLTFIAGNQARFSLFPSLLAALIETFGLIGAMIRVLVVLTLFWLGSLWILIVALYANWHHRVLAFMLVLALAPHYGNGVLSYGEPFVTGRVAAEGLGMLAIASVFFRRPIIGLAALLIAAAVHPLVAMGAAGIWLALLLRSVGKFLAVAAVLAAMAATLGLTGIGPFAWLFETRSPAWVAHLLAYESLGFPSSWGYRFFVVPALPFFFLVMTLKCGEARSGALARATLLVAGLGLIVAGFGADLIGNRLISVIQPWRALGWLTLLGNLMALRVFLDGRFGSAGRWLFVVTLGVNVAEHFLSTMPAFSAILALLSLLYQWSERDGLMWRWVGAFALAAATLTVLGVASLIFSRIQFDGGDALLSLSRILLAGLLVLAVTRLAAAHALGVVCVALAVGLWTYDARTPWQKYIESYRHLPSDLAQRLRGRTVYWEDGLPVMWFKLHQPQFYSCNQKSGSLFFEEQGLEFERRAKALLPLKTFDFRPELARACPVVRDPGAGGPLEPAMKKVCENLPELDVIVLSEPVGSLAAPSWSIPSEAPARTVYLYECADLVVRRTRPADG
ncbi:hypothetical protein [Aestuariicoccus sp. MJ-SS9]|uniref:hypothetical protein n=1 Tax=Aestuariicoccus sp. MJ-SS9 TaxID=3079855 RepID=UPI0029111FD6|nr:hypothetical protein [Aestuariicoccus sp. MJ-SS9]MDU8913266.1 hypothetical protein [Aestuariicoccus sp. MJ-SS9]